MRRGGTRAPRIPQLGKDWLVRASGRGAASKPVVTARLDHRCCKKCGYEFTVESSLAAVRCSLVVMEMGRVFWPCRNCGNQETAIVSSEAFPSRRSPAWAVVS
jgi:hypothetical protein